MSAKKTIDEDVLGCYHCFMRKKISNKTNGMITKDYLDERFNLHTDRLMKYINHRFEPIEEFVKKSNSFQDHVNKTLDWIVRKLEKYDQEYTIMSARYPEMNDKLDNHEKRISVLEKKTVYKTS